MGNNNRTLGVERWREYHVTHSRESVRDERCSGVGTVLLDSAGLIPFLEDPSEGWYM
jgi:hypothetical protein